MITRVCGIDIAKDSFQAALIDAQGQVLWSRSWPMSAQGFSELMEALGAPAESLVVGMESTGSYYLNLFLRLQGRGYDVRVLNPLLTANFAKRSLRKTKTDKLDAAMIGEFLRVNSSIRPAAPAAEELRVLARERESLTRQVTATKNEIKRLLQALFPELLRACNPFTVGMRHFLASYPSKDAVCQAPAHSFRGPKSRTLGSAAVREMARTSVGLSSPSREAILRSRLRLLGHLQEELEMVTQSLLQGCQWQAPEDLAILNSIRGLGEVTSAHFLAETHQRSFPRAKNLVAFAGIDPAIYESGQWKGRGRISKRGNSSLRRVLFLMATSVIRSNPIFRAVYERKRAEGKAYRQAVLAVAHKLVRVIHAMLRDHVPFKLMAQSI